MQAAVTGAGKVKLDSTFILKTWSGARKAARHKVGVGALAVRPQEAEGRRSASDRDRRTRKDAVGAGGAPKPARASARGAVRASAASRGIGAGSSGGHSRLPSI